MRLSDDLQDSRWMYLKALLFLILGLLGAVGIIVQSPTWTTLLILVLTIWAFARLYYFMFYVVEKYIDPGHRFAGVGAFLAYLWRNRKR